MDLLLKTMHVQLDFDQICGLSKTILHFVLFKYFSVVVDILSFLIHIKCTNFEEDHLGFPKWWTIEDTFQSRSHLYLLSYIYMSHIYTFSRDSPALIFALR